MPLALGETQTVRSLLAALIVHSANDAAIVLAHATMDQPAAQAAAIRAARALHRPLPRRSGGALRPAHERRGASARPARHRLPHAARPRRARRALLRARRAHARAAGHDLAASSARSRARQSVDDPGPRDLPTSNTLLAAYAGPGRRQDRSHRRGRAGTSRRAPSATACGCTRSCSERPTRRIRDATSRACSTGASTASCAARCVRAGQVFGRSGDVWPWSPRGDSRRGSIRASRCAQRVVLPRRLNSPVRARRAARLRRAAQRAGPARARSARRRPGGRRASGAGALAALARLPCSLP